MQPHIDMTLGEQGRHWLRQLIPTVQLAVAIQMTASMLTQSLTARSMPRGADLASIGRMYLASHLPSYS